MHMVSGKVVRTHAYINCKGMYSIRIVSEGDRSTGLNDNARALIRFDMQSYPIQSVPSRIQSITVVFRLGKSCEYQTWITSLAVRKSILNPLPEATILTLLANLYLLLSDSSIQQSASSLNCNSSQSEPFAVAALHYLIPFDIQLLFRACKRIITRLYYRMITTSLMTRIKLLPYSNH